MRSASSSQSLALKHKVREAKQQFVRLVKQRAPWRQTSFAYLAEIFEEYDEVLQSHACVRLEDACAFEIGCGQRPYRLFYLLARGVRAEAVDLDHVMLDISFGQLVGMLNDNGFERTAKSILRYAAFDQFENGKLRRFLNETAKAEFEWSSRMIRCGSAADPQMWPAQPVDFIYSEDVFEHIPSEALPSVCSQMASALSERGVAFVRPMVFTGIQGGHNVEWYDADADVTRVCPPWDHLRSHQFPANTYLNGLFLADYRRLFQEHFVIVEERVKHPDLGARYLDAQLRRELAAYSDEELFSNQVGFVLKRK